MVESEYLLGSDRKLTCKNDTSSLPSCQTCEDCVLTAKHDLTKEWFLRAGENSQKNFLFGIIRRIRDLQMLLYVERILRQVQGKDFIYSRSRMKPSLPQDSLIAHFNRALDPDKLWQFMREIWEWFKGGSYYTKLNYTLLLLQMCSTHTLHTAANLIQVLIAQGRKAHLLKEEAFGADESPRALELCGLKEPDPSDVDDPSFMVPPTSVKSTSGVKMYKDFISCLPVHLSKKILGFLNKDTLKVCFSVSHHWRYLAESTLQDLKAELLVKKEAMILQGTSNKKARLSYAKMQSVQVPKHGPEEGDVSRRGKEVQKQPGDSFHTAYIGQETMTVLMEERNLYCGPYNILFVTKEPDHHRVIHYDGGRFLAVGSVDHTVKVYDIAEMKPIPPLFKGHAGSVRVVHLCEEEGSLFTGGYDIGIRQWDLTSGVCVRVYNGHMKTVTCLDVHKNYLVSGSKDHLVKVWNITTGKCPKTFKHENAVFAVKINERYVVGGCEKGLVKVWHLESGTLIKTLTGHQGRIKCLFLDQWHLVSGGMDGNAIAWSMVGTFQKSLITFWHPKEVTSVTLHYLRVITSCADGKIRVFNFLSGDCLRVMRVTSRDDPVMSLCVRDNRLVINVTSSIIIFEFGNISWDYSMASAHVIALKKREKFKAAALTPAPYSYARAQRLKIFGSGNTKVSERQQKEKDDQDRRVEKTAGEKEEVQGVKSLSHRGQTQRVKSTAETQNARRESLPPITWLDLLRYLGTFEDLDLEPMFLRKVLSSSQKMRGGRTKPKAKGNTR
ncbi:F-box and WD repeat domain containing protein 10B [Spea bombifrons]|uniref:F-box and WD repeat domain containing protein 10B n=1 Tax=Spea bombifrons TaxID=233779 RepID=UPI00234B3D08|nr:F-box and WD repeat domain containing protein 10B [Spea bombifrons]XP_053310110.1 F-box and WD repeat domain containing protein 10B [Spea bombifrons]